MYVSRRICRVGSGEGCVSEAAYELADTTVHDKILTIHDIPLKYHSELPI